MSNKKPPKDPSITAQDEIFDTVNKKFPDMDPSESWEDYLDRKRDDLSISDINFLEKAIETWWKNEEQGFQTI